MKTLVITNQKGGTGKTTTALATAHGLAQEGYKVLFIDLDAQQNASSVLDVEGNEPNSLDVLTGNATLDEAIAEAGTVDAVAADIHAAQADKLIEGVGAEYRLKEALEEVAGRYDFAILDTPPALGIITVNALTAADAAIIPAQADVFSLTGIAQLSGTVDAVRKYSNTGLKVAGVLLTRYNGRATLSRDIREAAEEAAQALGTSVFDATIREAVAIKESQATRQSLQDYAPKANVTADYNAYLEELKGRL